MLIIFFENSLKSHKIPELLFIKLGILPTGVEIIGNFAAAASRRTIGKPSQYDGKAKQ